MAPYYKLSFFLPLITLQTLLLLSYHPASCNASNSLLAQIVPDDFPSPSPPELTQSKNLLQGLNSFRHSHNLTDFKKNKKAACLADELADELGDQLCSSADDYAIKPGNGRQFSSFDKLIKKCHIDMNTTTDGIIWPVCVSKLAPDLVITNYTHTQHAKYLSDSKYSRVEIGYEDDWRVVVLTTDTPSGSFSGAAALVANAVLHFMVAILLGLFLVLLT